jgi:hypothetical protein
MAPRIRPYRRADAPALIKLHERALLDGVPVTPDVSRFLRSFYESVLLDNPWAAADLPSLVYEGADGSVAAFVGVLPRPMSYRGRTVRAALITRVMADPGSPEGGIGVAALFRHALRGPQDLSLADVVNEPGRRLWEASKGVVVTAGSLWWQCPTPAPTGEPVRGHDLEVGELLDAISSAGRRYALGPVYDEASLSWLLDHLQAATHRGTLHRRAVEGAGGTRIGWYVGYTNPEGFNGVQQLGVEPGVDGAAEAVLGDLLGLAARAGGASITGGRLDLATAGALPAHGGSLRLGPWTYAHSRDRDLLLALTAGQAFLTRLEGEY